MTKKYDVVGIGNAIVDLLAYADNEIIKKHDLQKGMMKLVDEDQINAIQKSVKIEKQAPGGSAGNTIAGLAALGSRTAYIGKVQNDELGIAYENGMKEIGIHCSVVNRSDAFSLQTARCIVLVTNDAQRTFNTYLGISGFLGPDDVDESVIAASKVTYMEGYLWDREDAKNAFLKAIKIAHENGGKTALSLSDSFCVDRHRPEFLNLIKSHIDIVFANEDEVKSLFETDSLEEAVEKCKESEIIWALTLGADGSMVVHGKEVQTIPAEPIKKLVDTTGAGDLFAAGFLHAFTSGRDLAACGKMGNMAAAEVVQHFGPRLACISHEMQEILNSKH